MRDKANLMKAVGLVVCGWSIAWKNGDVEDDLKESGTCFSISPKGYLVTNKHVVEDPAKRLNMDNAFVIKDYARHIVTPKVLRELQEKGVKLPPEPTKNKQIKAMIDAEATSTAPALGAAIKQIKPKVWVFFGNAANLFEATVPHVSDRHDMAVLKISVKANIPFFCLAKQSEMPESPEHVFALGFPGSSRRAASDEEQLLDIVRKKVNIRSYFKERDFAYETSEGNISRVFSEEGGGRQWILHHAEFNHGNSGGPLVTSSCKVIGINTQFSKTSEDSAATYQSLAIPQLVGEILPVLEESQP